MAITMRAEVRTEGMLIGSDWIQAGSGATFDDLPEARWLAPALTTVRQPLSEMAATALRLLVRMMDGERPESTRTELSTRLVVRASTAPVG